MKARIPFLLVMATVALLGWGAMGQDLIQLSQLPPADRDAVLEAISQLERVLSDRWLGCGNTAVEQNWSEYQLARYVAGRLTGLGFPSVLAQAGDSWWVLSQVSGDGVLFWVPVVPGIPAAERARGFPRGAILGHIPWNEAGDFPAEYLAPEEIVELPQNQPPQGYIRFSPPLPQPGDRIRFFGSQCVDPDGMIVVFRWDFGDRSVSLDMNPSHVYDQAGIYEVTLTLVDDAGAVTVVRKVVRVREDGGGCGCGG